jgi:hypothetical protein
MSKTQNNLIGVIENGYEIVEAYGNTVDLEFLISDAITMARATGSLGATSEMGISKVRVQRITAKVGA